MAVLLTSKPARLTFLHLDLVFTCAAREADACWLILLTSMPVRIIVLRLAFVFTALSDFKMAGIQIEMRRF
jgi:hypothetical protein